MEMLCGFACCSDTWGVIHWVGGLTAFCKVGERCTALKLAVIGSDAAGDRVSNGAEAGEGGVRQGVKGDDSREREHADD